MSVASYIKSSLGLIPYNKNQINSSPIRALTLTITGLFAVSFFSLSTPAEAIPAFARQTGQPCASCHTAFPELTPFGRRFKLSGYTLGGDDVGTLKNFAAMILPSYTNTQKSQDAPPAPHTSTNDNAVLQQASLFYGGQIYKNMGGFVQITYDRVSERILLDNADIRYVDTTKAFGKDLLLGITVNNNPTVQDVWNTTPAWSFPQTSSSLAPQISMPGTMLEGGLSGQVVGTGAYAFWNDQLYLEGTLYQGMARHTMTTLGISDASSTNALRTVAPYWRLAFEPTWGDHSLMLGTFGMMAQLYPMRISTNGSDKVDDFGFDLQYQFSGDLNSFTLKASHIFEHQQLDSTWGQGNASNHNNTLQSTRVSGSWVYDHTYSFSVGGFDVRGKADALLYAGDSDASSPMGQGRPNGRGLLLDAAYLPFSHGGPDFWPQLNGRIGIQYTQYLKLYGGSSNFDGLGHNAKDNNTTYLYTWLAF